jgi:hypothetical protein
MKSIRLGSGSAYWGDMLEPALEIAEKGEVQYLGFDHLAELTMSLLQRIKAKDPSKGYIPDIIPWMEKLLPITTEKGIKMITNAGGVNPEAAADAVIDLARSLGIKNLKVGVILGDDLSDRIDELRGKGIKLVNLDTGEEDIERVKDKIIAAHAYIGADSIIEALAQGADLVIAGRVSDTAVYIGPIMHEFGWDFRDPYWEKVGAAVTVSHVIECAECATGGLCNIWKDLKNVERIGFPIAEVYEDGSAIITKVPGSGGAVNEWTIKEQLVYEVHDPANYHMPDGTADFTTIKLEDLGNDRVRLSNMSGKPRPKDLKVQVGYEDGWIGEGQVVLPWPDAYEKARRAEDILRKRFKIVGLDAQEIRFEYIGINALHGEVAPDPKCDFNEVGLRVAVRTKSRQEAEKVRREVTHLWTLGGIGSAVGVPVKPRPVISLWPTLVPRDEIPTRVIMKEV